MKFIFPLRYRNQYKINSKSLFSQLSFSNMALGGMPVFQADSETSICHLELGAATKACSTDRDAGYWTLKELKLRIGKE
jgi:hypothetical protein